MKRISQIEPWIGPEERRAVAEYLDSGGWLTEHSKTREFENMIAGHVRSRYACALSNGTMSLIMALMALGIGKGDEVIVPDFTMIAAVNAVVFVGAKPILVDVDQTDLCLDLEKAENAITPQTKGMIYVSLNGRCGDMGRVMALAGKNDLHLIEDAAQSLGSSYRAKHLGTFGELGSFSFSYPKIITTGQGGALVTDCYELYEKIGKLKDFGRARNGVDQHEMIGLNCKFTDLQAVIGIEQMRKLEWRVARKKEMYGLYNELLRQTSEVQFVNTNLDDTAPWFIDIVVINGPDERDKLACFLGERGIGTRPFYPPIHTQLPYSWVRGSFPVSQYVSGRGLWLPSSSFLSDDDIGYVCKEIKNFFSR